MAIKFDKKELQEFIDNALVPKGKPIIRWNQKLKTWDLYPEKTAEFPFLHFFTLIEAMDLVYGRTKITICNA